MLTKICKRCGKDKPYTAYYTDNRLTSGRRGVCIKCMARRSPFYDIVRTHKPCTHCLADKALEDFPLLGSARDKRGSWCKACMAEHNRMHHNKESKRLWLKNLKNDPERYAAHLKKDAERNRRKGLQ